MNIFVSNLCETAGEQQLRELFTHFGEVRSLQIIMSFETGRSQKFAFVEMDNREDGERAVAELNNMRFMGLYLEVKEVRPSTQR